MEWHLYSQSDVRWPGKKKKIEKKRGREKKKYHPVVDRNEGTKSLFSRTFYRMDVFILICFHLYFIILLFYIYLFFFMRGLFSFWMEWTVAMYLVVSSTSPPSLSRPVLPQYQPVHHPPLPSISSSSNIQFSQTSYQSNVS